MILRFIQLQVGIMLFGLGLALVIKANLGADPWTVFHVGIATISGISVGTVIQLTGACFLFAAWAFLRARVGIGSICNMMLVGPWINAFLVVVPSSSVKILSFAELGLAILVIGLGTALYIAAEMGAGPRDSFVLGLAHTSGYSIKYVRLGLELVALIAGYFLHGPVGIGTVIFALAMGPVMQFFLKRVRLFSVAPVSEKKQ